MSSKIKLNLIDLTSISGVMVDIDGTLYSYKLPNEEAIKACYKSLKSSNLIHSISLKDFRDLYIKNRLLITKKLYPQGVCRSRQLAFDSLFNDLKIPLAYIHALKYEKIYWQSFLKAMKVSFEMKNFLIDVKKHGLITCAVTDMQATFQVEKLRKLKLSKYIDFLATSEEAGAEKPNKRIFNLALQKMQLSKSKVIMIGDSIKKDIKGAESIGIKAIHYQA